jgi:hypothetical protein
MVAVGERLALAKAMPNPKASRGIFLVITLS